MATIIRMPEVLAGASEAAIASWLISEGQYVSLGDPIAEIETEKAVVEYGAEAEGTLGRTLLMPGDSAEVGAAIAVLIAEGETAADIDQALAGDGVPGEPELDEAAAAAAVESSADAVSAPRASDRLFVSPIARRIAKQNGVEPEQVSGTGPGGRIVRRDVETFIRDRAESAPPSAPATTQPTAPAASQPPQPTEVMQATRAGQTSHASTAPSSYTEIPHSSMRRAIARRLTESKSTVPHFYLTTECRVDELLKLRALINETSARRISVNDMIVKAAAAAFVDVPAANVTWADDAVRQYSSVDISIAVATEGGLVTPVVRDVAAQSLSAVSATIGDLAERAKTKRLKQDEIEGGSFSVTNLGMYGTLEFAAILNPPQSGILAVGAAVQQPVVIDGQLAVATVMRCQLSVDHRAVDGALAAQWLAAFTKRVENPLSILV
ncbi:MAG: branched-chain alpha-keto acid dehydrogenase subunit [Subtercola sp.]|nr:branched-chain alpha-keto acid dehydrogenase subunit [Subtercola sp.]